MPIKIEEMRVFKKDLKRVGLSAELVYVLYLLVKKEPLPKRACDHSLWSAYQEFRECHVRPDLLLVYCYVRDTLELARLGSHSDVFKT
ncbi:type II toxin-antitoxin system YafQ family toxin [Helicobacter salomonis]|uniref:type II toxin-antitoxin system YafQ family toxin n=1 Tax=Helicobacter salomonis TaxID=56878 RepID=UPI001F46D215|nr:type II toxin-antitoxin system YafQ family toxin [Helicobacter salomonis]